MPTGLSAFKWNLTALKESFLAGPCIRKWPFAFGHIHDLCWLAARGAAHMLILAPATEGLGQNGSGQTGCTPLFQPLLCSIPDAGVDSVFLRGQQSCSWA